MVSALRDFYYFVVVYWYLFFFFGVFFAPSEETEWEWTRPGEVASLGRIIFVFCRSPTRENIFRKDVPPREPPCVLSPLLTLLFPFDARCARGIADGSVIQYARMIKDFCQKIQQPVLWRRYRTRTMFCARTYSTMGRFFPARDAVCSARYFLVSLWLRSLHVPLIGI